MRCLVIDLDDTIMPTRTGRRDLFLASLRQWNPDLTEESLDSNWSLTFEEVVSVCAPTAEYQAFLRSYVDAVRANPLSPLPGAGTLLTCAKNAAIVTVVFTGTSRSLALADLEAAGLAHHVGAIIAAEDCAVPKPDPRAAHDLARGLATLGIDLAESWYVGDSLTDADLADALGLRFFGVTTGRYSATAFADRGVDSGRVFPSLEGVTAALLDELREACA